MAVEASAVNVCFADIVGNANILRNKYEVSLKSRCVSKARMGSAATSVR